MNGVKHLGYTGLKQNEFFQQRENESVLYRPLGNFVENLQRLQLPLEKKYDFVVVYDCHANEREHGYAEHL